MLSTVTRMAVDDDDQAPINPRGDYLVKEVVAERLERRIRAGEFTPGMPLPSEDALAEWYGVSRTSIRAARDILVERGLVRVRPHKGTFVTAQPAG